MNSIIFGNLQIHRRNEIQYRFKWRRGRASAEGALPVVLALYYARIETPADERPPEETLAADSPRSAPPAGEHPAARPEPTPRGARRTGSE